MSKKKPQPNQKEQLSAEMAVTRDIIFDKLAELKITSVDVRWSGGGDSGQIDSVTAHDEKQDIEIDLEKSGMVVDKVYSESVDSGRKDKHGVPIYIQVKKTKQETVNLEQMIGDFAEDLWDHFGQGGWYNNDGGFGNMIIDVKKREMKFEHYNYTQTEHLDAEGTI